MKLYKYFHVYRKFKLSWHKRGEPIHKYILDDSLKKWRSRLFSRFIEINVTETLLNRFIKEENSEDLDFQKSYFLKDGWVLFNKRRGLFLICMN